MENQKESQLKKYWPLAALLGVSVLAGTAIYLNTGGTKLVWMHYFMGVLFCQFSLLKLFDIEGFADGFQMYDLLAKRYRVYALCYPFIELAFGLAYLSFFIPVLTYLLTILIMAIGSVGVIKSIQEGLKINCACMGNVLEVPLSTVTLTEDLGMGIMALLMLLANG